MRKQQIILWSLLILLVGGGIFANNHYVNNRVLKVGEIESFLNYIYKTNLLNSETVFAENSFEIIIYGQGDIEFLRVLTADYKKLESLIFVPGQGYDVMGRGYRTERDFVEYKGLSLVAIESFIKLTIDELDLLSLISGSDGLRIRQDVQLFKDMNFTYDAASTIQTYIQGSAENHLRLIESDTLIPAGAHKFIINIKDYDEEGNLEEERIIDIYKYFD